MNGEIYRDIAEYSYQALVERCSDTEARMDLAAIESWLEEQIAIRVLDKTESAETLKKAAFLALLFIDFAKTPGSA